MYHILNQFLYHFPPRMMISTSEVGNLRMSNRSSRRRMSVSKYRVPLTFFAIVDFVRFGFPRKTYKTGLSKPLSFLILARLVVFVVFLVGVCELVHHRRVKVLQLEQMVLRNRLRFLHQGWHQDEFPRLVSSQYASDRQE